MSSGRKIFRLLKFLEDLKKLFIYFYKTPDAVKILKGMILLSGFFYHIMDNLVWGVNVGILNEFLVGDIRYKMSKNFFSLIRNWIKLIMDCIKIKKYVSYDKFNEEEIISKFNKEMSSFKINSNYNTIKQTLENRAKIRMKTLDIIHSSLRICMISYNLKLEPLYSISHPVYIALFGLSQVSISIFKHLVKISEYSNTYSIYGHFEINKSSSLEKLLIDTNLNEDQIFRPDYFDHYYIDFNKDYSEKSEKIIKYIPKRLNFEEE